MGEPTEDSGAGLKRRLNSRQVGMISLGGVIGAGLFVGSGSAIKTAGPGVLVAYAAVGLLVVLIMRMLTEMAVHSPDTGSFSAYATREFGAWAGIAVGYVYAYIWIVTAGFEATAAASILSDLVPAVPPWSFALLFMVVMTGVNLVAVGLFGELEFWFALVKVVTIVAFLAVGVLAVFGILPGTSSPGLENLTGHGGFFPSGIGSVVVAALVVMFSYFGTEVVTVAAGETKNAAGTLRKAMRSVVLRILIFYIGSIAIIVTLLPAGSPAVATAPFVAVLEHLRIPGASAVMEIAIVTAVLSNLNSGIYASSRMVFGLATHQQAPRGLTRTTKRGVPHLAILTASCGGFVTVAADYFLPTETVFSFLLSSIGGMALVVYLAIALTQLKARFRMTATETAALRIRMWGHPVLGIAVVGALLAVLVGFLVDPGNRGSTVMSIGVTVVACALGAVHQSRRRKPVRSAQPAVLDELGATRD
ncbi:amino acid permease [Amycolatopsis sp. NPDC049253]|uniref:amino acid permease n=1 Tax=Amycolatopsis sp. NPDC049253 TaxID=3155274 RepID=UPI003416E43A